MQRLKCDICGGKLFMDTGGKTAYCEYCGMQYSVERIQKKVQEIKGIVNIEGEVKVRQTGTSSDVQKWKLLLNRYIEVCDYQSALSIVRKILEAIPDDEESLSIYDNLREWQYYDVRNGVLVEYTGKAENLIIPEGVKKIEKEVFQHYTCESVEFPESIVKICDIPECKEIKIPEKCNKLQYDVSKLRFSKELKKISAPLEMINDMVKFAFTSENDCLKNSPWFDYIIKARKNNKLCLHCGSGFEGFFIRRCSKCGKMKDY